MALLNTGVQVNVVLALFNLVPLAPLDGSSVFYWGMPAPIANGYRRLVQPYGPWILLILLVDRAARPGAVPSGAGPVHRALSTRALSTGRSAPTTRRR